MIIDKIVELLNSARFQELANEALQVNEWFTRSSIDYAACAILEQLLDAQKVEQFLKASSVDSTPKGKVVGVVAAGNIPMVGFADMLYPLLLGYNVRLKYSSRDPLMKLFGELSEVELCTRIEELDGSSAILVMGSDAICTLLGDMFPTVPLLLRGSMHSVAIIQGDETDKELRLLCDDMLMHAARGCRSVTHLYLPVGYDLDKLAQVVKSSNYASLGVLPTSWWNCYRQQRAVRLMSGVSGLVDGGVVLFIAGDCVDMAGIVSYSYYDRVGELGDLSRFQFVAHRGCFGMGQKPGLQDYANGESVFEFLSLL